MGGTGKSYHLGVDLGTTYTAAAIWRDGRAEIANLGTRTPTVPSVLLLRDDGELLSGEAAEHRATSEPQRVAREFKRRVGDPTPLIVDKTPFAADVLMTRLARWVVDSVSEAEGGPPAGIAITHPANWGDYKKDLLRQALRAADLDRATMLTEPEAAAIHYASQERVDPGAVVAVYDLGGGTFDAAVLRRTEHSWEILGQPEGIERLGGVDFDEAVFRHVIDSTGIADQLDSEDETLATAVHRLRRDCVLAKEALSNDTDTSIQVLLPHVQSAVRLTRAEFEDMIRPTLRESIEALVRSLRSADVTAGDIQAVLLVGGSSRIPLVAQLISSELGRPVAIDAHPKHGVALGAAIVAAADHDKESAAAAAPTGEPAGPVTPPGPLLAAAAIPAGAPDEPATTELISAVDDEAIDDGAASTEAEPAGDVPPELADPVTDDAGRRPLPVGALVAVGAVLVVLAVTFGLLAAGGDDSGDPVRAVDGTTTVPADVDLTLEDVTGMDIDEARDLLEGEGFKVNISPYPEPTSDPSLVGTVAGQDPSAGTVLSDEADVILFEYEYEPSDDDGGQSPATTSPQRSEATTTTPPQVTTTTAPHVTTTAPTTTEPPPPPPPTDPPDSGEAGGSTDSTSG